MTNKQCDLRLAKVVACIALISLSSARSFSAPFTACPSEAFLVQDNVARLYGVNLATGFYEELSNSMGTSGKLNAMGFNFHDDYLYAWGYEHATLVRIHNDYQIEPLQLQNKPSANFYVGDVSINENAYYFYHPNGSHGLYRASLDPLAQDFLMVSRIADGNQLSMRIYDFAFHPSNGFLYSVDGSGNLLQIDAGLGVRTNLGNVGQSGTFGAVYFDADGNFYISRNNDGHIYRIDVGAENPMAEFFAFGPSSSNNDGARCALAPIISEASTIDFGDAPASYGVTIEDNGARHETSENLFLGTESGTDDGLDIVTGIETGLNTLMQIHAVGDGYANAWVDWDQNGNFDSDEKILEGQVLSEGVNRTLVDVPVDAAEGSTWLRLRYSSQESIGPNGGVSDGEVEDYEIQITATGVSIIHYPSASSFVTLAYEDNWPQMGDYDMNDVVVSFRTRQYVNANQEVIRYDVEGSLHAMGASYHNGFAVQLDGIETQNISSGLINFTVNDTQQAQHPLETNADSDDAIIVVAEDLWDSISTTSGCAFYRTNEACTEYQNFNFDVSIPLVNPVPLAIAPSGVLNPFIFASPGHYHGEGFATPPGRSLEIHLKNKNVSARFDHSIWGMFADASDYENGINFVNENNMPWGLEMPMLWMHPRERIDILHAYPEFEDFVRTGGGSSPTWYMPARAINDRIILNQ